jgi:nucleoside-diphosphate-sugar epimerase
VFRPQGEDAAIPEAIDPRKLDQQFAQTNLLRTVGTDHLLEAARAAGVRRFVAQSFAAWVYARTGGPVKVETDPVATDPPPSVRRTHAALMHVERSLQEATDLEGIVLRYGGFYGPGTSFSAEAPMVDMVRKHRMPIVGDGGGWWSFIHIDDAAAATVAAIERVRPGIFNVTDDEPAPVVGVAPRARCSDRSTAASTDARLARTVVHRRDRRRDDDRAAGRLEREGEARAGVAAAVRVVA